MEFIVTSTTKSACHSSSLLAASMKKIFQFASSENEFERDVLLRFSYSIKFMTYLKSKTWRNMSALDADKVELVTKGNNVLCDVAPNLSINSSVRESCQLYSHYVLVCLKHLKGELIFYNKTSKN